MVKNRDYLGVVILFVLVLCGYIFTPFLKYFAVATILSISTAPIFALLHGHDSFYKKLGISIGVTIFAIMFFFFPLLYITSTLNTESMNLDNITSLSKNISEYINRYLSLVPSSILPFVQSAKESLLSSDTAKFIGELLFAIFRGLGRVVYDSIFIAIFFTVFNIYGYNIFRNIYSLLPLSAKEKKCVIKNGFGTISLIMYSSLFNVFAMGFAFGIFISLISELDPLLFGLLAGFSSIIPVVGAMLVYIPVSLYFFSEGESLKAIITILYSALFMGFFIDNILRVIFIRFVKNIAGIRSNVNEVTIIFSMFAGVSTLGFWGIIIGPAVVSILLALIKSKRYKSL